MPVFSPRARARFAYVAMFAAIGAQAPYFVLYYHSRGFDLGQIGPIVALSSLAGLAAAPGWGAVSDRFRGAPAVILAPMALAIAGVAALSASSTLLAVAVSVTMVAAGIAGVAPIVEARGLETSGSDRAGYGPLRAWGSSSFIAAAWLIGVAVEWWGVGAALGAFAIAVAVTGLIGLTLQPAARGHLAGPQVPEPQVPGSRDLPGPGDVPEPLEPVTTVRPGLREIRRLFKLPALGMFLVGAALAWTSVSAVVSYYALRFGELGAPATYIGAASAVGAAVEVPVMLAFPRLASRLGPERLIVVGVLFLALRALLAGVTSSAFVLVLVAGVGGIGFGLTLVGGVTFVSRLAPPELQATAQGVFQGMTTSVGAITAGAIAAVLAGPVGLTGLYLFVAGLGLVAAVVITFAIRGRRGAIGGNGVPHTEEPELKVASDG